MPGGGPAVLLEDTGRHTFFQSLKVIPISLAVCPAFGVFFSEKLVGNGEVWGHRVDLDVQPEFGPCRLSDVDVGSVNGSHTAPSSLTIWHDLVWDEHGLLDGGGEASLPGKFGNEIPNAIVCSSVQPLGAAGSTAAMRVKDGCALFAPGGVLPPVGVCPRQGNQVAGISQV